MQTMTEDCANYTAFMQTISQDAVYYSTALQKAIASYKPLDGESVMAQLNWGSDMWRELAPLAKKEEVLKFLNSQDNRDWLKMAIGQPDLTIRETPKLLERVSEKEGEIRNAFKVINDLMACRVVCRASEIADKLELIHKSVKRMDPLALFHIRGSNPKQLRGGHRDENGVVIETIEYAYIYSAVIGTVVEVQVGERLSLLCFHINSLRRYDATIPSPFKSPEFFKKAHAYLLQQPGALTAQDLRLLVEQQYGSSTHVLLYAKLINAIDLTM